MTQVITDSMNYMDLYNYDYDTFVIVWGLGRDQWHYGRYTNKGNDKIVLERNVIVPAKKEPKKVILDETVTVKLGGPFEKIGEEDESVGGNNQKVGSANK